MPEIGTAPRRPAPQHREAVWEMRAQQAVEYEVVLTRDLLDPANDALAHTGAAFPGVSPKRCCVVTEATVEELYGDRLRAYFLARGIEARWLVLDPGEEHKNIESVLRVVDTFDAYGLLRRQEPVVAVGGGVLTDIVRHRDGRQRLPLATGIGSARFVDDVTGDEVRAATAFLRTYENEGT
jgi:hypothetical protein